MKLHPEYNDNQMVVAYYRYSSSSQNEASIEQQRQMVQRWAKAQGLVVVSEYEEAAKTGTNADRPGYQLMLRELPKIKPAYARSGRTTVSHEIEPSYCSPSKRSAPSVLAFITSRGSPPPTDSPDSVLTEGVADAFAEYYSLQLSPASGEASVTTLSEPSPTGTRSSASP